MLRDFKVVGLLLLVSCAAVAGPISGLYDTGPIGWTVRFGSCPLGANNCLPGDTYLGQTAEVPVDAHLVQPNVGSLGPNYPIWNTDPFHPGDSSLWITPSVRAVDSPDGPSLMNTVRYLPPDPGGTMDFGDNLYEFRLSFNMDGLNPNSAWIEIVWLADGMLRDDGCGIVLNTSCYPTPQENYQYYRPGGYSTRISQGFESGENVLSFFVLNRFRETGLRATFSSFADPIPEPSTYAMMALGVGLIAWKQRRRA